MNPNFFIVGAAKAGTTSLYHYLSQHPQICMSSWKEPHFFGEYRPPGPVLPDMESYLDLFSQCGGYDAVGEASTQYLYSPSAANEISAWFPKARIIIILRNPVDRAYSLFWNHVRDNAEKESFERAIEVEEERRYDGWSSGFHYVLSGMYSEQILRYLRCFDKSRVKIIFFKDFKDIKNETLSEICSFLSVDYSFKFHALKIRNKSGPSKYQVISNILHNSSTLKRQLLSPFPPAWKERWKLKLRDFNMDNPPPMKVETRDKLIEIFKADILRLEEITQRDLSHWLERL